MKKVKIELNEVQARMVMVALEEWFRIRMGQEYALADGLAFLGFKKDPEHPERFDAAIQRRDSIIAVIRAMFNIAWPHYGRPQEVEPEVNIATDIWSQMKWVLNDKGAPYKLSPLQLGSEPLPKIIVEEEE